MTLELAPGSVATEGALIERVGLGRTPVREAIQRLAWEGLIEVRPRAGLAIAPLHAGDWLRVLDARRGVEEVLARSAARYVTREAAEHFHAAALAMQKAVISGNVVAFLEADKALDEAIAAAADNPFAARLAAPLADAQPPLLVPLPGRHRAGRGGRAPCRADPRHPRRRRRRRRRRGRPADGAAARQCADAATR